MPISSMLGSSALLPAGLGFRNKIINGGFDIWQRSTSAGSFGGTPVGAYVSADRWRAVAPVGQTLIHQAISGLEGSKYCARVQKPAGGSLSEEKSIVYTMESIDASKLAGQTITFSFYARKGADFSATGSIMSCYVVSGTGTDQVWNAFTGASTVISQSVVLTSTWQRFVFSAVVPTNSNQLYVKLGYVTTGVAGANDYFEVTNVQLEQNYQPTPFEQRPIGIELALCQRYYETSNGIVQVTAGSTGFGGNTYWNWVGYKVEKRIALNLVTNSTSNGVRVYATDGGADYITMWKGATQYYSANEGFEIYTTQGFGICTTGGQTDAGLARFWWFANAEL